MSSEPPLLPPSAPAAPKDPPASITFPPLLWAAWLAGGGFTAWLNWRTGAEARNTPYQIGAAMGGLVACFLIPAIIAWLVWRLGGRRGRGHVIAFLLTLLVLILGQVNQALQRVQANEAVGKLEAIREKTRKEFRSQLASGQDITAEQSVRAIRSAQLELRNQAENLRGDARGQTLASQVFFARIAEAQQRYAEAGAELNLDRLFEMETVATAADRAAKRAALARFSAAVVELRGVFDQAETLLQAELEKNGVSKNGTREFLAGYRSSAGGRLPKLAEMRDLDLQLAAALGRYLDLAERCEGRWSRQPETRKLLLPDDASAEEFNHLLKHVQQIQTRQRGIQKTLLGEPAGADPQ